MQAASSQMYERVLSEYLHFKRILENIVRKLASEHLEVSDISVAVEVYRMPPLIPDIGCMQRIAVRWRSWGFVVDISTSSRQISPCALTEFLKRLQQLVAMPLLVSVCLPPESVREVEEVARTQLHVSGTEPIVCAAEGEQGTRLVYIYLPAEPIRIAGIISGVAARRLVLKRALANIVLNLAREVFGAVPTPPLAVVRLKLSEEPPLPRDHSCMTELEARWSKVVLTVAMRLPLVSTEAVLAFLKRIRELVDTPTYLITDASWILRERDRLMAELQCIVCPGEREGWVHIYVP